ncbi:MAG: tetratricopeptide repeat protein [Acidobacteriota bacterium]
MLLIAAVPLLGEAQDPSVLGRAQAELDRGNLTEAAALLRKALEVDSKNKSAHVALVDALMRSGHGVEAAAAAQSAQRQFPGDGGVTYVAAAVALGTGRFEEASRLAKQSLAEGNQRAEVFKLLAMSRFLAGDAEGFYEHIQAAIERDPNSADSHYHLGRYYFEKKMYTPAIESFGRTSRLDPDHYKASYFTGLSQQGSGEGEAAEKSLRKAIEIIDRRKIRYGWPFADLGEFLTQRGRLDDGLGWLYRGTRNDPGLPYTHLKYAMALLQKEPGAEVQREIETALKLDPAYTEAYYQLGRYYSKTGQPDLAREAFAKFQELRNNPKPSPAGVRRQQP